MEKFNRKDWLEYINNLNNREISKRNSSGITTWALFGLIGFLLFELIDGLPIILMNSTNIFLTKLFIANISNFFMVTFFLQFVLFIPIEEKKRVYNAIERKMFFFSACILYFVFIIGLFSNINIVKILKYYELSDWPYFIFASYDTTYMIFCAFLLQKVKKKNKIFSINSRYVSKKKIRKRNRIIYLFLFLISLILFLFSIYQIMQNESILSNDEYRCRIHFKCYNCENEVVVNRWWFTKKS